MTILREPRFGRIQPSPLATSSIAIALIAVALVISALRLLAGAIALLVEPHLPDRPPPKLMAPAVYAATATGISFAEPPVRR